MKPSLEKMWYFSMEVLIFDIPFNDTWKANIPKALTFGGKFGYRTAL